MNDQERAGLIEAVSNTITNHFMAMVPAQPDAASVRAILEEMVDAVALATAALLPGFEQAPARFIEAGRIQAAPSLDWVLKTVMAPGSKAWQPQG